MSALLTTEAFSLLSSIKGKSLKSLEYHPSLIREGEAFELLRVNLAQSSVLITCFQERRLYFDEEEDVACFGLERSDPKVPLYGNSPMLAEMNAGVRRYLVGERVTGVEVVREHVVDPEDGEAFDMDVTIALRTPHQTVSLSRQAWFHEEIDVRTGLAPDADAASVQPLERTTLINHMTQDDLRVTREVIVL